MQASTFRPLALVAVVSFIAGCGGPKAEAPPATVPPPPALSAEEAPPPPPVEPSTDGGAAENEPTADEAVAPKERDPEAVRDVRFVALPDGLKIEVDGVRFMAKAEPVRTPAGFHVRVTFSATASEKRSLLSPKNGPLAFAGAVKRAGKAEPESFGDERSGDGDEPLGEGTTVKISREWPPKGVRPLGNGDSLELDVGLWGLGTGPSDRKAVKQFARVKASVAGWKGKASVVPPPALTGK